MDCLLRLDDPIVELPEPAFREGAPHPRRFAPEFFVRCWWPGDDPLPCGWPGRAPGQWGHRDRRSAPVKDEWAGLFGVAPLGPVAFDDEEQR